MLYIAIMHIQGTYISWRWNWNWREIRRENVKSHLKGSKFYSNTVYHGHESVDQKGYFSIMLQAVVDDHGCFIQINARLLGKEHDERVLRSSLSCWSGVIFPKVCPPSRVFGVGNCVGFNSVGWHFWRVNIQRDWVVFLEIGALWGCGLCINLGRGWGEGGRKGRRKVFGWLCMTPPHPVSLINSGLPKPAPSEREEGCRAGAGTGSTSRSCSFIWQWPFYWQQTELFLNSSMSVGGGSLPDGWLFLLPFLSWWVAEGGFILLAACIPSAFLLGALILNKYYFEFMIWFFFFYVLKVQEIFEPLVDVWGHLVCAEQGLLKGILIVSCSSK